jgi:thiamine biosynthesis lipoprotein
MKITFKHIFALVIILIALFFLFFFPSCKNNKTGPLQTVFNEGFIQGTTYHITYLSPDGKDYHTEITKTLHEFDKSLSTFDSTSVISRINRNDSTVCVDSLFQVVFLVAKEVSEKTDGAFDITVGPLVRKWGFYNKHKTTVTQAMIDSILPFIGYQKVRLEKNKIHKDNPAIVLDANAIAQGFSCDIIAQLLDKKGVKNYMVEIGGEIKTRGKSPRGDAWKVGINQPIEDSTSTVNELQEIIRLTDMGLATSGNYRKFYYHNGKKYAHEIDPHTGYPVTHNLLSATIIEKDAITADAYATACMVMGLEKSLQLIEQLPDIEGYFIYKDKNGDNQTVYSRGFEKFIEK